MVQVYSVRHRDSGLIGWSHRHGPGRMQRAGLARALDVPGVADGRPLLGAGLAIWDQMWPGHEPGEALELAFDAAVDVCEARLWSSKWIVGHLAERRGQADVRMWLAERAGPLSPSAP